MFGMLIKKTFFFYTSYVLIKVIFITGLACSDTINPFKPNGFSNYYQVDQSIFVLKVVEWYYSFLFKSH